MTATTAVPRGQLVPRVLRAELQRLLRRRTLVVAVGGSLLFAVVATLTVFSSAQAVGVRSRRAGTTLAALADHGGGTEAFAVGASFVGFLVFVTFIALLANEFSGGTFRALLLRDPHRVRLIVGKLAGVLLVAAGMLAVAEAATFVVSLLLAPSKDIPTSAWFSLAGAGAGLRDYATVLGGVAGWAVFGTTLAVIFRSAPLALGVGFAWAGPFENIVVDSWSAGYRYFPGQVLGSLIQGGTAELGVGRAAVTALLYCGVAAAVALTLVSRRDVTS
jgi:ABC-type transport system involved in multi-copper enzyme maturation permease subunit